MYRGGRWTYGAAAGLFSLHGGYARSGSSTHVGFRSAFVRYSGDSGDLDNLKTDSTDQQHEPKHRSIVAPDFLGRIRQAIAHQLQKLYEAAGGEDLQDFARMADEATGEQLQLAATTSITIKEVPDHE